MNDTLKVVEHTSGLSDTVWLALITGLVGIATLIIKSVVESQAKKAERVAASEALKVSQKLEAVEIKIDGRLTEILELTRKEAEERGHRLGKEQERKEETDRKQETTPATVTTVQLPGATKLKIIEGEIKVTPSETKKKP